MCECIKAYGPLVTQYEIVSKQAQKYFHDFLFYCRISSSCRKKCISNSYKEAELNKGEAVCLDRCVMKYMDLHQYVGQLLTKKSKEDETEMAKAMQKAPS